jgi:hypothetical protein
MYYNDDDEDEDEDTTEDSFGKKSTRRSSSFLTPSYDTKHKNKVKGIKISSEGRLNDWKRTAPDENDDFFDVSKQPERANHQLEILKQLTSSSPLYTITRQEGFHHFQELKPNSERENINFKKKVQGVPNAFAEQREENTPGSPRVLTAKNKEQSTYEQKMMLTPKRDTNNNNGLESVKADHINLIGKITPTSSRETAGSRKKIFEDASPAIGYQGIDNNSMSNLTKSPNDDPTSYRNKFAFKNKLPDNRQIVTKEVKNMVYYSPNPSKKHSLPGGFESPAGAAQEESSSRGVIQQEFMNKKGFVQGDREFQGVQPSPNDRRTSDNLMAQKDEAIKNVLKQYKAENLLKEMNFE